MVNSLARATSQQSHNPVTPVHYRRTGSVGSSFRQSSLAASEPSPAVGTTSANSGSTASQILGTAAVKSQNPVTSSALTPALTSDAAVLQSLEDALAAAGITVDGLGLATHQDVVTSPGGSYINRYISVQTNGHEEGLMTDLVALNPNVAVIDVKRMLGRA